MFYSSEKDGKEVVKLEQWLDECSDNEKQLRKNWRNQPVRKCIDDGNWETDSKKRCCGGSSKQIISWEDLLHHLDQMK